VAVELGGFDQAHQNGGAFAGLLVSTRELSPSDDRHRGPPL
jgi:hypothetical protein